MSLLMDVLKYLIFNSSKAVSVDKVYCNSKGNNSFIISRTEDGKTS